MKSSLIHCLLFQFGFGPVLIAWALVICLIWLVTDFPRYILRRVQFFLGWLYVSFMARTDPNNGGA